MIKEFEIKDILDAVDAIFKKKRKNVKITKIENDSTRKKDVLSLNNQVKSNKSKILVLGQMIE